jgi:WYL_2, Sm-like SH3 beta-barrel fold
MSIPYTLESLVEALQTNVMTVVFTKVNGEQRIMKCTLIPEKITKPVRTAEDNKVFTNSNNIVVWDLEKNDWRAFKFDRITSVTIE